ncbi:MAG: hypothetical protein R2685_04945 [Candidatus Nitrosocosmicus sp.]|nr:hypothetical protein [Candidatus Nitrosocosmicus sp.]
MNTIHNNNLSEIDHCIDTETKGHKEKAWDTWSDSPINHNDSSSSVPGNLYY